MEPNNYEPLTYQAQTNGVNIANFVPTYIRNQAREGQASQADILLAINRMMGLAPARTAMVGETPVRPIIPSDQAAREASVIYNQSGAAQATSQEQQMALVQALMQKLGIF